MRFTIFALLALAYVAHAQKVGTNTAESHLDMPMQDSGSTQSTSIVLDSNWRWTHHVDDYVNCYDGNEWSAEFCPDAATCTENCAIDGVDQGTWSSTYGISASGGGITLTFVTQGTYSTNIGSRVYLLASEDKYKMFYLKNREFSVDIDASKLPCGLNGALYFVEMEEDGGMASYPSNEAGAKYGTGYCDAQCPHDMKFIAGMANSDGWVPSDNDQNAGSGKYGICCFEMDIWEANSMAQSFTTHDCNIQGYYPCEGSDCGDNGADRYSGVCDKDGCDFAAYRVNQRNFYGPGLTVDSSQAITVITQFITSDGSDSGDLVEVRRVYQQGGQTIQNTAVNFDGVTAHDSITDDYCTEIKDYFGDVQDFEAKGGMRGMGQSLDRGHVLVMSLWDDHYANMLWLDSSYPTDADPNTPGIARGPCPVDGGDPNDLESNSPGATVKFSNLKIGPIQSYDKK